jgi:hypothetical protein
MKTKDQTLLEQAYHQVMETITTETEENKSMIKNVLIIDLYTGQTDVLPAEELNAATKGLKPIETKTATTYKGEEYMVVVLK